MMYDLIALEVVLLQQHGDGAGVATLGDDGERPGVRRALGLLALLLVDQVERQVVDAGGIPRPASAVSSGAVMNAGSASTPAVPRR